MAQSTTGLLTFAALLGAGATLANVGVGGVNCSGDASYCAYDRHVVRWEGRLFDPLGRPGAHVAVSFDFGSVAGASQVRTRTDAAGRFCVLWPPERVVAGVTPGAVAGSGRADARFARGAALDPVAHDPDVLPPPVGPPVEARVVLLTNNRLLDGGVGSGVFANYRDWRQDLDSPRHCEDRGGPPWYRRDGAFGNWRSLLAIGIGLLACATALVGLALRRRHAAGRLVPASLFLGVAAVAAFIVVWAPVL
jgi:hypothetical protein